MRNVFHALLSSLVVATTPIFGAEVEIEMWARFAVAECKMDEGAKICLINDAPVEIVSIRSVKCPPPHEDGECPGRWEKSVERGGMTFRVHLLGGKTFSDRFKRGILVSFDKPAGSLFFKGNMPKENAQFIGSEIDGANGASYVPILWIGPKEPWTITKSFRMD